MIEIFALLALLGLIALFEMIWIVELELRLRRARKTIERLEET